MSAPKCARTWEAEAVEDGRLPGESRTAYARHAERCAECRAEITDLRRIRELARASSPLNVSELERRRQRAILLRRANEERLQAPSRRRPVIWALAAFSACIVACVLVVAARRVQNRAGASPSAEASVSYDVADVRGASWTVSRPGAFTIIGLADGRAAFHVEHLSSTQRFVVALPDGELEVRGTRFVIGVDARSLHTTDVAVTEGIVVLRLTGAPELILRAGDRWAPPLAAAPSVTGPAAVVEVTSTPTPKVVALPKATAVSTSMASTSASPSPSAKPSSSAEAAGFGVAMSAFQAGKYAESDVLFARFLSESPGDARCEDALFLRAVAHARMGDRVGAKALIHAYLAAYPEGLRREEARRFAETLEN